MAIDERLRIREQVSSEKRKWVRLTKVCNNRCVFCLDKEQQDGTALPFEEIAAELEAGAKEGSVRAILSGGEATIHPRFIDIVSEAKRIGYQRVQVVTNGRMFAYKDFLKRAIAAGLGEITFSIHGHTPELHDAQTRVPGSFKQTLAALINALGCRGLIVNMDIVINGYNYAVLDEIIGFFVRLGVREFDLLHITPYGDAWENRDKVFYDVETAMEPLNRAFAYSRRPDMHIWTNRFPPRWLSAFPELVQSPLKIKDEVRGRMDFFEGYLYEDRELICYGERCRWCFLEGLCDEMRRAKEAFESPDGNEIVRVASIDVESKHSLFSKPALKNVIIHGASIGDADTIEKVIANNVAITLVLNDYTDATDFVERNKDRLTCVARDAKTAARFLKTKGLRFDIEFNSGTKDYAAKSAAALKKRGVRLVSANRMSATESAERDIDLREFFAGAPECAKMDTVNIPGCVIDTRPAKIPWAFDAGIIGADGRIEPYALTYSYIEHGYYVYPSGCGSCALRADCPGVHINDFRARGFTPEPK